MFQMINLNSMFAELNPNHCPLILSQPNVAELIQHRVQMVKSTQGTGLSQPRIHRGKSTWDLELSQTRVHRVKYPGTHKAK